MPIRTVAVTPVRGRRQDARLDKAGPPSRGLVAAIALAPFCSGPQRAATRRRWSCANASHEMAHGSPRADIPESAGPLWVRVEPAIAGNRRRAGEGNRRRTGQKADRGSRRDGAAGPPVSPWIDHHDVWRPRSEGRRSVHRPMMRPMYLRPMRLRAMRPPRTIRLRTRRPRLRQR